MHKFDFNILSHEEFEQLIADIVAARENAAHNTSFRVITQDGGPDGGIDFKMDNGNIIGQAKRLRDIKHLRDTLKKEVAKVTAIKPRRYILVISLPLSFARRNEIITQFHPFIKSDADIIDQIDLSRLLEEHPDILLRHTTLWSTSVHVLQHLLTQTINKALNESKWKSTGIEIEAVAEVDGYFVASSFFYKGIEILKNGNFLIITGDPGIGKTTLARALCHYFLENKKYKKLYCHQGINPPLYIPDPGVKSIFFIDDFLGSNIWQQARIEDVGFFQRFIDKIYDEGHLLIATTREYIYQQEKKITPRFGRLDDYKCLITLSGYTQQQKFDILLKNALKAPLSLEAVESLKKYAYPIINSPGYNPKLIAEFIRTEHKKIFDDSNWGYFLHIYIISPYAYWEPSFLELSPGSQLFLLCLFISDEPALHYPLLDTFRSVSKHRQISMPGFEADVFAKAIAELNDTFIYIDKDTRTNELAYSFSSTLIKDFLLEYLRKNDYHIEYLIKGAIYWNQLFYAFTTREEDYQEDDSGAMPFQGARILLNYRLQGIFVNKLITEFEQLPELRIRRTNWNNGEVTFDKKNKRDNRVARLKKILEYFDVNLHKNRSIAEFLKQQLPQFAIWEEDNNIYLHADEFAEIPGLIYLIHKQINVPPTQIFENFFFDIRRTSDFLKAYELKKIYKKEFDAFIKTNLKELVEKLDFVIWNDINAFKGFWLQMRDTYAYYALNDLFDFVILDVFRKYNLTLSERKWKEWLKDAGLKPRKKEKKKVITSDAAYNRNMRKANLDINSSITAILPNEPKRLTKDQVRALITQQFPDQSAALLALFSSRKFLYELVQFPYQLAPIVHHAIALNFNIASHKTTFIIAYTRAFLQNTFTPDETAAIVAFAAFIENRNWPYFHAGQFTEFARTGHYEKALFDKMIKANLLAGNNNWYCFLYPDVLYLLHATHFKTDPDKNRIYQSAYRPGSISNFPRLFPYLAAVDYEDFHHDFVFQKFNQFLRAVHHRDPLTQLKKYFRFFDLHFSCKMFRGKMKYEFKLFKNELTNDLFNYCYIRLSDDIFKKFPYESAYFREEKNEKNCARLLKYMERNFMSQDCVKVASISDEKFWDLLAATELAALIHEEVKELKDKGTPPLSLKKEI